MRRKVKRDLDLLPKAVSCSPRPQQKTAISFFPPEKKVLLDVRKKIGTLFLSDVWGLWQSYSRTGLKDVGAPHCASEQVYLKISSQTSIFPQLIYAVGMRIFLEVWYSLVIPQYEVVLTHLPTTVWENVLFLQIPASNLELLSTTLPRGSNILSTVTNATHYRSIIKTRS